MYKLLYNGSNFEQVILSYETSSSIFKQLRTVPRVQLAIFEAVMLVRSLEALHCVYDSARINTFGGPWLDPQQHLG